MSWALISDSSCNLRDWQPTAPHTTFAFAPLKIRVGEREFVDDLSLDVHELNCAVQAESSASSSACPSVGEWAELFKLADKTICMPISGAYRSFNARPPHVTWCLPRSPTARFIWSTHEPQVAKWI
ncbi:MAG: DegV family protein [Collinsella sp.]